MQVSIHMKCRQPYFLNLNAISFKQDIKQKQLTRVFRYEAGELSKMASRMILKGFANAVGQSVQKEFLLQSAVQNREAAMRTRGDIIMISRDKN